MNIQATKRFASVLSAVFLICASSLASAQSLPRSDESDEGWRHSITPYLFLPLETSGVSTVAGRSANIDLSLGEVLDVLQGAASLRYEGWKGDWGIQAELYHVYIGENATLPTAPPVNVDVDVRQTYLSLMGSYRFANGRFASGERFAADLSFGARWNRLKQEINITTPLALIPLGGSEEWIEPAIGIRYMQELNDRWTFGARAEFSGFGVNGNDLQYLVLTGFDWRAWDNTHLRMGYQFYGLDFSTTRPGGTFAYDVDQHGPYLGLAFHF